MGHMVPSTASIRYLAPGSVPLVICHSLVVVRDEGWFKDTRTLRIDFSPSQHPGTLRVDLPILTINYLRLLPAISIPPSDDERATRWRNLQRRAPLSGRPSMTADLGMGLVRPGWANPAAAFPGVWHVSSARGTNPRRHASAMLANRCLRD